MGGGSSAEKAFTSEDVPSKILASFTCCQCNLPLSVLPIHMYNNGDNVCGRCELNSSKNPKKNVPYEELAKIFEFPCVFSNDGCMERRNAAEMLEHEIACRHRIWKCPAVTKCNWTGYLEKLMNHYESKHKSDVITKDSCKEINLTQKNFENHYLYSDAAKTFLIQLKKTGGDLYLGVGILGVQKLPDPFYQKFHLELHSSIRTVPHPTGKNKVYFFDPFKPNLDVINATHIDLNAVIKSVTKMDLKLSVFTTLSPEFNPLNDSLLKRLECPICFNTMLPPIFQCSNGHPICDECKQKIKVCAICKDDILNFSRIRVFEDMVQEVLLPCRHCLEIFKGSDILDHVKKECKSAPRKCPFKTCDTTAVLSTHLKYSHSSNFKECVGHRLKLTLTQSGNTEQVWKMRHGLFKFEIGNYDNAQYFCSIYVIEANRANKIYFLLTFLANADEETIVFKLKCQNIDDVNKKLVLMPAETLKRFIDENGQILCTIHLIAE